MLGLPLFRTPSLAPSPSLGLCTRQVAQKPLTLDDLPPEDTAGKSARQLIGILHRAAVARQRDMYIDPLSGYPAFSSYYLRRRECCGNKCRHCPCGHKNIVRAVEAGRGEAEDQHDLDW